MKLNIITDNPGKVLSALQDLFPRERVNHEEICSYIHDFEIMNDKEPVVYSMDALMDLTSYGISIYNIRIY